MKSTDETIEAYNKERNAILAQDDNKTFINWAITKNVKFSCTEAAEIARHKMITACVELAEPLRAKSKQWLIERSYQPWDN